MKLLNKIKKGLQRAKKGYCYEDTYSIYDWFLSIMPQMLEEMSEGKYLGAPGHIVSEFEAKHPDLPTDEADELAFAYWRDYLRRMAYYFREANEPTEQKNEYRELWWNNLMNDIQDDMLEKKWLDREYEIEKYQQEQLSKAFKMFTESFYDLWW